MSLPPRFLSCDWGTTSFRLRLVESRPFSVLAERRTGDGAASVHGTGSRPPDCAERFRAVLERESAELLEANTVAGLDPALVLISGMASSTIGWVELPYAGLPFPLDSSGVVTRELTGVHVRGRSLRVLLQSGVASTDDVLRGEEAEILGGFAPGSELEPFRSGCLLVLPGTHSKHAVIERGLMTSFRTYLTGELFALLSGHSVLRHSLVEEAPLDRNELVRGVERALEEGTPGSLFSVRARQVLGKLDRARGGSYLSGLLLGGEVNDAFRRAPAGGPVVLCAAGSLHGPYDIALRVGARGRPFHSLPPEVAGTLSSRGHLAVLAASSAG